MRNNKLEFPETESDEEYLYYRRNSLNSNQEHKDCDQEHEKMISYFADKICALEKSFYQRNFHDDLSQRDRDFLIDLIKTLFKEVSDVSDYSLKIHTKNLNKTEKIRKITTIHKELFEKYTGLKMNYKSVIKQAEYKEKQISDLESLIKACDLEIYELNSKINQMKNNFSKSNHTYAYDTCKNNNNAISSIEIQEMSLHHEKEKEDLNLIIDNLRNNLIRRENFSHDLKAEIKMKSYRVNELSKEIERYKHEFDRCKINLELEKKFHTAKAEELKYLSESFLFTRKKEYNSDLDLEMEQSDSSNEGKKRMRKKNSRAHLHSHRLINNIKFDQKRDFSYRKRSSLYNNTDSKSNPEHKIVKSISYFTPYKEDILEVNSFAIDSEPSLVNVSILDNSQSQNGSDSARSKENRINSNPADNTSPTEAVLDTQEPQTNHFQALDCIMSVNEGSVTDNKAETKSSFQMRYKKKARIAITNSMEFVEQGLMTAKNRLNKENLFHTTNSLLDVQSVSNFDFICHKNKSNQKKRKLSTSNCNNIININFNNFDNKNLENFQSDNSKSKSIQPERYYDKLLSEDFYQMIFENIKNWNEDVMEVSDLREVMNQEKIFKEFFFKHSKLLANNFDSFIELYFSDLIYLIYFFYNSHFLII